MTSGIAAVAGLELGFAAQVRHAKAVAVTGDAADHAFDNGVIPVYGFPFNARFRLDGTKAERVHDRERPRAHGEDVAQDAADAGGRALVRLDVAGMVVRLDFEGAGPAVAHVDDAGIFARPLDHAVAFGGQALEVHAAGFVRAVFAPHHAEDAQLSERRNPAQCRQDAFVLVRGDAVRSQQFRGHRCRLGGE